MNEVEDSPEKDEDQDEEGSGVSAGKIEDEHEEEDTSRQTTSLCQYTSQCNTGSRDYRKVISHIFGRNKKCTTQIPDSCWIIYCRKHYQRTRYRTTKAQRQNYFLIQFDNLARQLTKMEEWGGVRSWEIGLRKKEREILNAEDSALAQLQTTGASIDNETVARVHRCPDRYLLAYVGDNKTYADVRHFTRAVEREVERTGATQLPGFELLPDIIPDFQTGGVKNTIKFETTRSSVGPSRKQTKKSPSTSRGRSTSRASNRRRLVQGKRPREDDEDSIKLEDDKMESPAEITGNGESALPRNLSVKDQQLAEPAKKKAKDSRTTEEILEQGWFPKEQRLRPPPSRSTTPKSSTSRSDSLRKEAGNRSASKQNYPHISERLGSPQLHVGPGKSGKEQSVHSDVSRTSFQGYDPWPNSTPEKAKAHSVEPSTPVFDSNIQSTGKFLKKGTKRSAGPATPMPGSSLVDLNNDTKRARLSYSEPSKKPSSRFAMPSSPDSVAYRPAVPKTPTRGTDPFNGSLKVLPEMRKFQTPRTPRTPTHGNRFPSVGRTPTPQVSRAQVPHANSGPTAQSQHSMTPQQLLSSPTPLHRRASPGSLGFRPVNDRLNADANHQLEDDQVKNVTS